MSKGWRRGLFVSRRRPLAPDSPCRGILILALHDDTLVICHLQGTPVCPAFCNARAHRPSLCHTIVGERTQEQLTPPGTSTNDAGPAAPETRPPDEGERLPEDQITSPGTGTNGEGATARQASPPGEGDHSADLRLRHTHHHRRPRIYPRVVGENSNRRIDEPKMPPALKLWSLTMTSPLNGSIAQTSP